jgi:hypothetical protein
MTRRINTLMDRERPGEPVTPLQGRRYQAEACEGPWSTPDCAAGYAPLCLLTGPGQWTRPASWGGQAGLAERGERP